MNLPFKPVKKIESMRCDGVSVVLIGCRNPVAWGLRIHVPSLTQEAPGHRQIRFTLLLHSCHEHKGAFKLDDLLRDNVKATIEGFARKTRPIDFKCDFDSAFLQYVDVFGPEYKKFLAALELGHAGAEDKWGAPIAKH